MAKGEADGSFVKKNCDLVKSPLLNEYDYAASEMIGDYIASAVMTSEEERENLVAKLGIIKVNSFAMYAKTVTFVFNKSFYVSKAEILRQTMTNGKFYTTNK